MKANSNLAGKTKASILQTAITKCRGWGRLALLTQITNNVTEVVKIITCGLAGMNQLRNFEQHLVTTNKTFAHRFSGVSESVQYGTQY